MRRIGYLFERFPSFGQTFCYREVAELIRQGVDVSIFSIRRPIDEPAQDWDETIVRRVEYLPDEHDLVREVVRSEMPETAARALREWGRRSDFLRLYQAVYVGMRLQKAGITRVHAHFAGMAARTSYWIRRFFGIEFSLTAHANDIFAPREFEIGLTSLFADAAAIVTVSDFAVENLRTRFPEHAKKIHRVYNGIDVAAFRTARFTGTPPVVISVGRLIEKKGFDDLIRACAAANANCKIIGEGPLEGALRAQIDAGALRVQLLGAKTQREIAHALAAATVFVLACKPAADGDTDNLPTVIMEAMAAGLPVVSTRVAGIPEMIEEGKSGFLVEPGDVFSLTTATENILQDRPRAQAMGARGREIAAAKFSLEENVRVLAQILARSATQPITGG